jgi:hypothetical protein
MHDERRFVMLINQRVGVLFITKSINEYESRLTASLCFYWPPSLLYLLLKDMSVLRGINDATFFQVLSTNM